MSERGSRVTEAALVRFEKQLGTKLPDDYRAFLIEVNGGQTELSHSRFMLVTRKGRRDWTLLNSLNSIDDPDDRSDLVTRWTSSRQWLPPEVIPIGFDDYGGAVGLVLAGPRRGQVWFLDGVSERPEGSTPRVEWFDQRDVFKLAHSFREFMAGLGPPPPAEPVA